jgi:cytochrome c oxidase subunit 3
LIVFIFALCHWFYDIILESTFEGHHTLAVQQNIRLGMVLFIISEVMFFFSFFWAFFYLSGNPSLWIGDIWPPVGIEPFFPWGLPFLNTIILLSSGVSVTVAHKAIIYLPQTAADFANLEYRAKNNRHLVTRSLLATVVLGILFTLCQLFEYKTAAFSISDSIYGSIFYVTTGFHGLHVIIGTIFLCVCLGRHINYHFTSTQHVGLECAIWYWHFVDVVWLFLFILLYWWSY